MLTQILEVSGAVFGIGGSRAHLKDDLSSVEQSLSGRDDFHPAVTERLVTVAGYLTGS